MKCLFLNTFEIKFCPIKVVKVDKIIFFMIKYFCQFKINFYNEVFFSFLERQYIESNL
jgi:hypothetical protein